jgi:hypothetical protein
MRSVKGALAQPHTITPRERSGIASTPVLTESLTSDSMVTVLGRLDLEPRPGATKSERTSSFDGAPLLEGADGWTLSLVRYGGHIYVEWDDLHATMFSTAQLQELHGQFFHPSADKIYNVLKRSRPEDTNESMHALLKIVTDTCHPCQLIARKPITFTVGSASDPHITFNREIALDILYLRGRSALLIVDIDKHFHALSFLRSASTDDIWDALLQNRANIYGGFPESILTDQGSQFVS